MDTKTEIRNSPSAERNKGPIFNVLKNYVSSTSRVLEIASGTGQHAAHFASQLPGIYWQTSDVNPSARNIIKARIEMESLSLPSPMALDVCSTDWHALEFDTIVNINMIHISPWQATEALMLGAGKILAEGGILFMYGPYFTEATQEDPSTVEFDNYLKRENPQWGVRALDDVKAEASRNGLRFLNSYPMPRENICVTYRRQ